MKTNYVYFVIVLIIFFSSLYFVPRSIVIDNINCKTQFGACGEHILSSLDTSKSLHLKAAKRKANEVLSANYLIQDYAIRYKLPSTLDVSIIENTTRFALYEKEKNIFILIDESGRVLSYTDLTALPVLEILGGVPEIGANVNKEILFCSSLVARLKQSYEIDNAKLDTDKLVVKIKDKPDLVYPTQGDIDVLLGSTVLVLSRLKQEGEDFRIEEVLNISEIDFRFKNLVLR
ncbi:hypothetical protein IPM62_04215 [Candidatus Woesebacteria bacterium]|nr:MAG: hypothetical protein IPM62_04215 [Candidatus Woesebacteria bacterium]